MGIDEAAKRKARHSFVELAHPQRGVNEMKDKFPNAGERPDGVRDVDDEP